MKPPIFIYEPVDLLVFRDINAALSYLEPIDVENGVGIAFDSEGQMLNVRVSLSKESNGKIIIEESNGQPRPNELKKILVTFLSHPRLPEDKRASVELLMNCSLPDLVLRALHFECR